MSFFMSKRQVFCLNTNHSIISLKQISQRYAALLAIKTFVTIQTHSKKWKQDIPTLSLFYLVRACSAVCCILILTKIYLYHIFL